MIDLVFYGEKPTVNNFRPIKNNQGWSKPQGGLWTSPMIKGNISAWKYWCDSQHMSCPNQRWHVIMSDACRIIEADENLDNIKPYLVKTDSAGLNYVIDFEKMAEDFDFLYISNETVKQHKNGVFAGFDVPTGLFLNMVDKNSHKLLFKGLDDVEFESFKAKCRSTGRNRYNTADRC